jgi:hypothetical protein
MGAQDVDVELVRFDVRVLFLHDGETLVPERKSVHDAIGLGGRGYVPARPRAGQLERVTEYPVHAAARKDRQLIRRLHIRAAVDPSADLRILAFVVLTHDDEVDLLGRAVGKGGADPGQEAHRTDAHVLLEIPPDGDQKLPERHMVRDAGVPHRTEVDGVTLRQPLDPVLGHHAAVLAAVFAGVRKLLVIQTETVLRRQRVENLHPLWDNLLADAVSRNQVDAVLLAHVQMSSCLRAGLSVSGSL